MDIQPGTSTRTDVARSLGLPVRSITASRLEYRPQQGTGPIFVDYREGDVVDRIEVNFTAPVAKDALVQGLKLPSPEFRDTSNNRLADFYGNTFSLIATYGSAAETSGVVRLEYCSRDFYEKQVQVILEAEKHTSFRPADCQDVFQWAETEQLVAKKSKDPKRLAAILQIRILAQRGDCSNARSMADTYRKEK